MKASKPNWVEKFDVKPGDHVIAVITNEDDAALVGAYVSHGVEKGNVCSIVASASKVDALKEGIRSVGADVDQAVKDEKLMFFDPGPMGEKDGKFDVDTFCQKVADFADNAGSQGIKHIQNTGVMSWLTDLSGTDDILYLEARLNEVFENRPISGMCIYDSRMVGGDVLIQLMRSHPKIWLRGEVVENLLYKKPREVIAELGRN